MTIKATDQADKEFLVNRNNAKSDALKATNNNVQFTFSINDDELCIDDFLVNQKVKQLNFINNNTKLHRIDILFLPDRKKMNNNDTKPEKGTMEDIKLYFEGFDTLNLQYQDDMLYKRSPINIESDKKMELLLNNYNGDGDDFYSLYKVRNNSK